MALKTYRKLLNIWHAYGRTTPLRNTISLLVIFRWRVFSLLCPTAKNVVISKFLQAVFTPRDVLDMWVYDASQAKPNQPPSPQQHSSSRSEPAFVWLLLTLGFD